MITIASIILRRPRMVLSFHRCMQDEIHQRIINDKQIRFVSRCYRTRTLGVLFNGNAATNRLSWSSSFDLDRRVQPLMTIRSMDHHTITWPKNLADMTSDQLQTFLNSFDVILSDCDGVLWIIDKMIPGAIETLKKLQDLGKRVYLVSNNSLMTFDRLKQKVRPCGLDLKQEQAIFTSKVIAWYLNKINFRDEVFVIASNSFRRVLAEHGIKMAPELGSKPNEDDIPKIAEAVFNTGSTKAVVIDFSFNAAWMTIAHAVVCLSNKDVLYLTGTMDEWLISGKNKKVLGWGPIIDVISRQSGRTPILCAKPSDVLEDYMREQCQINDPKRCLFIGDSRSTDMAFATKCGFQKLFVESGIDKIGDVVACAQTRPDYYLSSLGVLLDSIDRLYKKNSQ